MTETPLPETQTPVPAPAPATERSGCVNGGLGCLLVLVGIPLLICPGPGVATIASGLAMIGSAFARKR